MRRALCPAVRHRVRPIVSATLRLASPRKITTKATQPSPSSPAFATFGDSQAKILSRAALDYTEAMLGFKLFCDTKIEYLAVRLSTMVFPADAQCKADDLPRAHARGLEKLVSNMRDAVGADAIAAFQYDADTVVLLIRGGGGRRKTMDLLDRVRPKIIGYHASSYVFSLEVGHCTSALGSALHQLGLEPSCMWHEFGVGERAV